MSGARRTVRTTCPYCGTGCGVEAHVGLSGDIAVAGDPWHPANSGRLCVKGAALAQTLTLEGRLLQPQINGAAASWTDALRLVARRFNEAIAEHGPDSVALYVSGQMLTEDYYVANKFMKGFVGSANIDTNSRLCMASSVAGHKRAFGADVVPNVYEDLELADVVVLTGSNLAWCHPVLFQRLEAAKAARPTMRVVNIDPRRTATSEIADLHLALKPGGDVALFLGLLRHLARVGKTDPHFVDVHTIGAHEALATAEEWDVAKVGAATGLHVDELRKFFALVADHERVVTVYSQGVNQSSAGTDRVNAILNCHLLTGRIGKPGSGPFSVTGQPNAMGGREVGGLANQLACHMELDDARHREIVRRFWECERIAEKPGLKAVDLFEAVRAGAIKALWIIGTNPVDSLPQADRVKEALAACPFVVVSDVMAKTDSASFAHVVLPARPWGEKDGTVTNSERRISRQRAFAPAAGAAMPDWWIVARVARLMGAKGFDYSRPAQIFREYAALSGFLNQDDRAFDISACAELTDADYDAMQPFQWPWRRGEPQRHAPERFFAKGGFYTPDGRARLIPTGFRAPQSRTSAATPFVLNTGRVRDQWHTMTRTGVAPRLTQHIAEPYLEIHPADARRLGIEPAGLVRVSNAHGAAILRALVTDRQQPGSIFAPIHWTDQNSSAGRVDVLVEANVDPVSGQPESKACAVAVAPFSAAWFGFALTRHEPPRIPTAYWAMGRTEFGWRIEVADAEEPADWDEFASQLLGIKTSAASRNVRHIEDRSKGDRRWLADDGEKAAGLLLTARAPVAASRAFLCETFAKGDVSDFPALLAGRPCSGNSDRGRTICVCHGVGQRELENAIACDGLTDLASIGRHTRAGTGCGSCRPEIQSLLKQQAAHAPRAALARELEIID